jgi:hypothetical protein
MAKSFRETIGVSPSSASTSDSTLLIIDAQNEYADGLLRTENVGSTRKAIAGLLEKYRAGSGSIVHIVHDTPQGAPVFTLGSQLAEEFDEVKAKDEETVIHKVYPGSFADTDLDNILKKTGKNKLVITGYMVRCRRRLLEYWVRVSNVTKDVYLGACLCVNYCPPSGSKRI